MQKNVTVTRMIWGGALLVTLVILGSIGTWFFRTGILEVRVENGSANVEYTYEITNQKTNKKSVVTSTDQTISQRVPRGDYEVLVTQSNTSFLAVTATNGLLKTTTVPASLSPESSREFVGNEPESCMYYDTVLYSFDCNQEYTSLKTHIPSTTETPTYTQQVPRDEHAFIKGLVTIDTKPYILVHYNELDGEAAAGETHVFTPLDTSIEDYRIPKGLQAETPYLATNLQGKPLLYTEDFGDIQLFENPDGKGKKIAVDKPSAAMNVPVRLSTYEGKIGILYNSLGEEEEVSVDEDGELTKTPKGSSELLLYEDNKTITHAFDKPYNDGTVCGEAMLCLKLNGTLDLYDISGEEPKLLMSILNVMETLSMGDRFIIATETHVLSFDTTSRTGYIQYKLGEYRFCGLQQAGDQYLVCVIDPASNTSSALLINPAQEDSDSIDKKILKLRESVDELDSISIYKNILYTTPKIGEQVFNMELGFFTPDPEKTAKANMAIEKGITDAGIDRDRYVIINIFAGLSSQTGN